MTTLAEDLIVLAHDPAKGRPLVGSTRLACGLAGALLADLALAGRISIDADYVYADRYSPSRDTDLDTVADRIAVSRRNRKVHWWVNKLQSSTLRKRLLERSTREGALHRARRTVLVVFPRDDYYPRDPDRRSQLRRNLRGVLLGEVRADARTMVLLALVGATGAHRRLFPDLPNRERRRRIKTVVTGDTIGRAVRKAVQSSEAASAGAGG
ncbi:GOLPH3/VPS74 family protein [Nocardiopsis ansamitocini]|uniref:GPP34 family phosphoprotein n=1 Tax=Nocardiopsis ansamitocini TaxID=1670832 RepID=A0A9W6UIK8_9ACTN|nr:GPP34 family phosphoprotein [Nocardiopsis ansamitocini]GLU47538.1 hypothetical protein Nans01_18890 [Nocardiopsis ansamitocini]